MICRAGGSAEAEVGQKHGKTVAKKEQNEFRRKACGFEYHISISILCVLQAASFGGTNIDPNAWEDKKWRGQSRFPAQVRVGHVIITLFLY